MPGTIYRIPARSFLTLGMTLLFMLSCGLVAAQEVPVVVEKSTNRVVIDGRPYYIHVVKAGETLYSISRAYQVPQVEISRENPMIMMGLQTDMAIKIPILPEVPSEIYQDSLSNYIYHSLEPGQTLFYLSRQYQVDLDEILQNNPGLAIDDIPTGTVIKIPRKRIQPSEEDFRRQDPGFVYHQVKEKETLFALSREYDVPIRLIRRANDGLPGGLKAGMVIRIPLPREKTLVPISGPEELPEVTDTAETDTETTIPLDFLMLTEECASLDVPRRPFALDVALFLPFYLEDNDVRSYIDSSEVNQYGKKIYKTIERDPRWIYPRSYNYIEFYEGAMLAVDQVTESGQQVNLHVFDTERDSLRVRGILNSQDLDELDLIIGPVFTSFPSNFQLVAGFARDRNIPVVSPLSPNSSVLQNNPYVFQVQPAITAELDALAGYMSGYRNANLVLVHEGDSLRTHEVEYFKRKLFNLLSFQSFTDEVLFKEVVYQRDHPTLDTVNTIEHALSPKLENLVVVLSESEPFVTKVASNLFNLTKEYKLKALGMSAWQRFENIDLDQLFGLNLHHFTNHYIDYSRPDVLDFLVRYRKKFKTEPAPASFAWDGYDIMYYFLSGMSRYGPKGYYCLPTHHTELLHTGFSFQRQSLFNGFENREYWLLEYAPDLTIRKVDWQPLLMQPVSPRLW